MRAALEAMVSLQVTTAHGRRAGVRGGGRPPAGWWPRPLDAVAGARSIDAVTAFGHRERAVVVAGDPGSDVAVLRVDGELQARPVRRRDPRAWAGGTWCWPWPWPARPMPSVDGSATMLWAGSTVRSVGTAITRGGASGMGGIDAAAPSMPSMAGEVLVQGDGRVLGLLDARGHLEVDEGLPARGPGRGRGPGSLAATGRVRHGWLDVIGRMPWRHRGGGARDRGDHHHRRGPRRPAAPWW